MDDELLDLIGNWVEHIGATIAAIGETKQLAGEEELGYQIGTVGNAVQGIGNALQAIAGMEGTGAVVGNWIQASGTAANSLAEYKLLQGTIDDIDAGRLEIIGDSLQSFGSMFASLERLGENPKLVYGNILQSIGAALEGIGVYTSMVADEQQGQLLETIGGWFQSIGTAYQAIGATRQYLADNQTYF
ncbi:hypothetical protein J2S74_004285 [Evansella vedderi]|uniref:Uncharacterized protein n=1 Tax=Evansella vedderi TaxID=38282 RepID=A0ABU0A045_9BACI|nr:hypothetical protein [Evansella vedderi]MDQ0256863.1 hypothetical protein [Evansella vedderi]